MVEGIMLLAIAVLGSAASSASVAVLQYEGVRSKASAGNPDCVQVCLALHLFPLYLNR
jgi:hypothetical protein